MIFAAIQVEERMKVYQLISSLLASSVLATPALAQSGDWTGPYAGVYTDVAYDELGVEDFGCWTACTKPTVQGTAIKAGASAGYDVQIEDTLVFGLVADLGTGSRRKLIEGDAIGVHGNGTFTFESDVELEASIRARAGLAQGDTLIYITGGMAFARGRFNAEGSGVPTYWVNHSSDFNASWSGTVTGPTFGGGIEHQLGPASVRFEVLHKRFAPVSACFANVGTPNPGECWQDNYAMIPPQVNYTYSVTNLRLGINYRF